MKGQHSSLLPMSKCIQSLTHVSWGLCQPRCNACPFSCEVFKSSEPNCSEYRAVTNCKSLAALHAKQAYSEAGVSLILIGREETGVAQGSKGSTFPWLTRRQSLPFTLWLRQNPLLWMLRNCYRNSCSGHCVTGRARDFK